MQVHECVCFIVIKEGQVLLEKRSMDKASDPGMLNIPGGHMEMGETQQQTLIRELDEELSIRSQQHYYLCSLYHSTSELQLIHYYVVTAWQGQIQALEADEVFWAPVETAPLDIAPDQVALREYLRFKASGALGF